MPGVRWIKYGLHRPVSKEQHPYLRQMEDAVLHGQAVARILLKLRAKGFTPDVILAHPGWGETLYAKDVFPDSRLIHFAEWFYGSEGSDLGFDPEFPDSFDTKTKLRTWNALHTLNLELCDAAVSPTDWQRSRHPRAYQHKIEVAHEGIDADILKPDPLASYTLPSGEVLKAGDPVVTYVARNLEPYRGFHTFMRALMQLQQLHPRCQALIVGGDDVSYGAKPQGAANWREKMLGEMGLTIAMDRTHFLGKLPYPEYRKILQISAAHVYLTYPFVLSWSCLEAMASGCVVVASNTAPVREVIEDGKNGRLVDFFDVAGMAKTIADVLESRDVSKPLRRRAREHVQSHYSIARGQQAYERLLSAVGLPPAL